MIVAEQFLDARRMGIFAKLWVQQGSLLVEDSIHVPLRMAQKAVHIYFR